MTLTSEDIAVGDWLAFYQGGAIVYSVVVYKTRNALGYDLFCTPAGIVQAREVLEVRHPAEQQQ